MRIIFPTIERAKQSAKALKSSLDNVSLSTVQNTLAQISGYRDWHELNATCKNLNPANDLTGLLPEEEYQRAMSLAIQLSVILNLSWSTALYAISRARIYGANIKSLIEYESIWLELMKQNNAFSDQKKSVGSIVKLNVSGRMGEACYLKKSGRPTFLVSHRSADTCVGDFEITVPRTPLAPFIPARLKYAYGYWTEADGAKVLFSRDYKPLWRIRDNKKPERLEPWLWIKWSKQDWFWGDENPPWYKQKRFVEEEDRLQEFGITALPKLTDLLPDLIFDPSLKDVRDAVDKMAKREAPDTIDTGEGRLKFTE